MQKSLIFQIVFEEKGFNEDQQNHLITAVDKGFDVSSISVMDNSFSVEDIDKFTDYLISKNYSAASEFVRNREEQMLSFSDCVSSHDNDAVLTQSAYPEQIESVQKRITGIESELLYLKDKPDILDDKGKKIHDITIDGKKYTDRESAGAALNDSITKCAVGNPDTMTEIGEYKGFRLSVAYNSMFQKFTGELTREVPHKFDLGTSSTGNITRIENVISSLESELNSLNIRLGELNVMLADGKEEMNKPFPQAADLHNKMERFEEIEQILTAEQEEKTAPEEKSVSDSKPKEKPLFSRAIQKDFADKAKCADAKQPEKEKGAI